MKVTYIVLDTFTNDSRVLKQATSLVRNGYQIEVVALYKDGLKENEILNKIKVRRIKLFTRHFNKGLIPQTIQLVEFAVRLLFSKNDRKVVNSSSLGPLPVAVLLKFFSLGKIKVVYDARELESERNDLKGLKKKIFGWVEKILIRYVDEITTVSESIAVDYVSRYKVEKPKLLLNSPEVHNIVIADKFREKFKIDKDVKIFLYQGALSYGRGIDILLQTFQTLENPKVAMVFMGYGPLENEIRGIAEYSNNIYFHAAVSPSELLTYTSSADVGISLIENTSLSYYYCLPNKFFEYSMAGLPILVSNLYELNRMVRKYECGVIVDSITVDSCISAINSMLQSDLKRLGANARKMAIEYSWEMQEPVLLSVYNKVQ